MNRSPRPRRERAPPRAGLVLLLLTLGAGDDRLRDKAEHFRDALYARHLSPEGLVLHRVDLTTIEEDLRNGTYPDLADTPTYNGMLAAGACGLASDRGQRGPGRSRTPRPRCAASSC